MNVDPAVAASVVTGAFGVVVVLVQRGRHETTDRFDRLQRQLDDVKSDVVEVKDLTTRVAVVESKVETINERHHLIDLLHPRQRQALARQRREDTP